MVTPSECPHVIKLESDFISTPISLGARLYSKKNCREPLNTEPVKSRVPSI